MKFEEALKYMRKGKKVKRKSIENVEYFIKNKKIICEYFVYNEYRYDEYIKFDEIMAEDWEVTDEQERHRNLGVEIITNIFK